MSFDRQPKPKVGNVLFIGGLESNDGPSNVNRELFTHWPVRYVKVRGANKVSKALGYLRGFASCDCLLSSAYCHLAEILQRAFHATGRPSVVIAHGYPRFENSVNGLGLDSRLLDKCDRWLSEADAVIVFSEVQAAHMRDQLPALADKLSVCPMGLDPRPSKRVRAPRAGIPIVAVSGGTRPIKNNGLVAEACRMLCLRGDPVELRVYGTRECGSDGFLGLELPGGTLRYMDQVDHGEWLRQLAEVDVFVMASSHESFGLSAIEAIQEGCSLLISEHCGASEAMDTLPLDLVSDTDDPTEVAEKISHLVREPNNARLAGSIDYGGRSWDVCARDVWNVCCDAADRLAIGVWKKK